MRTLLSNWRARAEAIDRYAPTVAAVLRDCAAELEASLQQDAIDTVSVREAAILSGYTPDAIGRMIKRGDLVNMGTARRPRVRRIDVPRKPGRRTSSVDLQQLALSGRTPAGRVAS